jgi:hypothetical protein
MNKSFLILTIFLISLFMVAGVSAACVIDVTAPDGGDYWAGTQTITWTASENTTGDCGQFSIYYNSPTHDGGTD